MVHLLHHRYEEKWRWFGEIMHLPEAAMDTIQGEIPSDEERLRAVVQYWILRDPHASWRRLITQLYRHGEDDLAGQLLNNAERLLGMH